jgi:ferredoxin
MVIDGAVGSIPLAVFQAAARECPERAIIISETAAAS